MQTILANVVNYVHCADYHFDNSDCDIGWISMRLCLLVRIFDELMMIQCLLVVLNNDDYDDCCCCLNAFADNSNHFYCCHWKRLLCVNHLLFDDSDLHYSFRSSCLPCVVKLDYVNWSFLVIFQFDHENQKCLLLLNSVSVYFAQIFKSRSILFTRNWRNFLSQISSFAVKVCVLFFLTTIIIKIQKEKIKNFLLKARRTIQISLGYLSPSCFKFNCFSFLNIFIQRDNWFANNLF